MKKLILIAVCVLMATTLSGCLFGYKLTKTTPEPVVEATTVQKAAVKEDVDEPGDLFVKVPVAKKRTLRVILDEMLSSGELLNRDVHGRKFGSYEYTWELVVIKERTGDVQAAVIENGELILIEPVKDLESARSKFKPYGGGWRK